MAPQIIWIVLAFIGLLLSANQHGKPKTGEYNFWVNLASVVVVLLLLIWGGFFNIFLT